VIPKFDAFVAIDWSGAKGKYDGIAVARCRRGRSAPELVGARWTRTAIAAWLIEQLKGPQRLLIGLDFGFAFPFEDRLGYLGGTAPQIKDAFALWAHIERKSCDDVDFGCSAFTLGHKSLFWRTGSKPRGWVERKRQAEHVCFERTRTRPDTLFKLIGPKQVGKASMTGMRVLHHVRSSVGRAVSVWPFEQVRSSAMVEIYPTLFRYLATRRIDKLTFETLNDALGAFGSQRIRGTSRLSDHETDALISAAGLRHLAGNSDAWALPRKESAQIRREGWIFGVGAPI
jgi:hypothetical protein